MNIKIKEWVGTNALTLEDGHTIFNQIHDHLRQEDTVVLDFDGVETISSLFFSTSVGRLLEDLDREALNKRIRFINLTGYSERLLRSVIEKYMKGR